MRPTPAQRPRSVATTSRSSPMGEHHADNLPRRHPRGTCAHMLLPCSPGQRTGTLALDQLPWSARRRARRRSLCACEAAAQTCCRPSCRPRTANVGPSLPARPASGSDDQAARDHSDPSNRCANRGLSRGTDVRDPARCGQRRRSGRGHRTPVCPDTRITPVAWTPVAWTPDLRPTSWTDARTADSGRGQGDERCGRRPDIRDGGGRRLGGANLGRVAASAALGGR
jgi:hypothetical protein